MVYYTQHRFYQAELQVSEIPMLTVPRDVTSMYPTSRITLREVGLRDGLQLTKTFPEPAAKQHWIEAEYHAGVRVFEVGSFLPANRFPQFADVRELIKFTKALPGAYATALTLNERGVEDALQTEVDELDFVLSATEGHSQSNTNRTRAQAVELLERVVAMRNACGPAAPLVNAGVAVAFGCTIEGRVKAQEVLKLVEACMRAGADTITISDTVGYAGPRDVSNLVAALRREFADARLILHFHDTRGMAIANAAAALDEGVTILDATLGGLGGCPFAPGATGNIVIEDLAYLCHTMGFKTGIDIPALVATRQILEDTMPEETLYGALARSGLPPVY